MAIQLAAAVAASDFAWLIGSLCQINRIPFDHALLLQRYPAPHSVTQLIDALRSLGFRAGEGELATAAYPCIGFLASSEGGLSERPKAVHFARHFSTKRGYAGNPLRTSMSPKEG